MLLPLFSFKVKPGSRWLSEKSTIDTSLSKYETSDPAWFHTINFFLFKPVPVAFPPAGPLSGLVFHTNWIRRPLLFSCTFQERDLPEIQAVNRAVFTSFMTTHPGTCFMYFVGITAGFQQTSYNPTETGSPLQICAQLFVGDLQRNVTLTVTSTDDMHISKI